MKANTLVLRLWSSRLGYPSSPKEIHISCTSAFKDHPIAWRSDSRAMFLRCCFRKPQSSRPSISHLSQELNSFKGGKIKSRTKKELDFIIREDCEWESAFKVPTRESNQGIYYKQRKSITEHFKHLKHVSVWTAETSHYCEWHHQIKGLHNLREL